MLKLLARSFRPAAWLGWQVESNWTDPVLFFALSVVRPIAGVLILVFMVNVVSGAGAASPIYAYIYLGNAFYIYVISVMAGASYSVLDDRERYRVLKYLYIAPIHIPTYLFGRAMARFITGTIAVVITLAAGVFLFDVPIHLGQADWPLFFAALPIGILCLAFMGIIIGSWTLTIQNEPWFIGDAVAASLYLFSGAIFPVTLLPAFLQPVGFLLPMAYWFELLRRALLGAGAAAFPTLAGFSNPQLFAILTAITLGFGLLAALAYRYFERVARERGLIDVTSNF